MILEMTSFSVVKSLFRWSCCWSHSLLVHGCLNPKPLIWKKQHEQRLAARSYGVLGGLDTESVDGNDEHEEFEFGEICVHQTIHTMEFALGASCSHRAFSCLLIRGVLVLAFEYNNIITRLIGVIVLPFATLVMETLGAFLHTIRLHWVEFQNKPYMGWLQVPSFHPFSEEDD